MGYNQSTSLDTLAMLAEDKHPVVRRAVAANRSLKDPKLIRLLAYDKDSQVREGVAHNLAAQPDVLDILATDQDKSVRLAAAWREPTLLGALLVMAESQEQKDMISAVFAEAEKCGIKPKVKF